MAELVIADDFSGAAEIAGIAWRSEKSVVLTTGTPREHFGADCLVIDTDTRPLPGAEAATRLQKLCEAIAEWDFDTVFKKIDSALRPAVSAEIEAVLAAMSFDRAVLVPANPSRCRIIRGGEYFIDGIPLDKTAFGSDPLHPARTNNIRKLIGDTPLIQTPDAVDNAGIMNIASALRARELPVGAADFYETLTGDQSITKTISPGKSRRLWICGSPTAAEKRLGQFTEQGIPFIEPVVARQLSAPDLASRTGFLTRHSESVAITAGTLTEPSGGIVSKIADTVSIVLTNWKPDLVFLEGGATARAVINALGLREFQIEGELAPGVVAVRSKDHPDAPLFVTKPGSYNWPDSCFSA